LLKYAWEQDKYSNIITDISGIRPGSGAALATVVGVLVEVPVMLSVCKFCVATRPWYERGTAESR